MTTTPTDDLPALPKPRFRFLGLGALPHDSGIYTGEDMRAYAQAAILADRQARAAQAEPPLTESEQQSTAQPVAEAYQRGIVQGMNDVLHNGIDWARAKFGGAPLTAPPRTDAPLPLLVRDVAAEFGTTGVAVSEALRTLGLGDYSVNMAVTAPMMAALRNHFTAQPRTDAPALTDEQSGVYRPKFEFVGLVRRLRVEAYKRPAGCILEAADALEAIAAERALRTASKPPGIDTEYGLHPATQSLVLRFSQALAEKLSAAELKYGYSDGWARPDWMDECRQHLREHVAKGDPRDVAAYCAFLWHHGESTASKASEPAQDEALKADAARYRVVRGDGADANNAPLRDYCFDADGSLLYGHDLDAACDAAIAQIDALEKPPEAQGSSGRATSSGVEARTRE